MYYLPEVVSGGKTLAGVPASTGLVCAGESGRGGGSFLRINTLIGSGLGCDSGSGGRRFGAPTPGDPHRAPSAPASSTGSSSGKAQTARVGCSKSKARGSVRGAEGLVATTTTCTQF